MKRAFLHLSKPPEAIALMRQVSMGSAELMALEYGFGKGREARERQEVTSPWPSTPPHTVGYVGGGDQVTFADANARPEKMPTPLGPP